MGCGMGLIFNRKLEVDPKNDVRAIKSNHTHRLRLRRRELWPWCYRGVQPGTSHQKRIANHKYRNQPWLREPPGGGLVWSYRSDDRLLQEGGFPSQGRRLCSDRNRQDWNYTQRTESTFHQNLHPIIQRIENRLRIFRWIAQIEFHIFDIDKFKSQDLR